MAFVSRKFPIDQTFEYHQDFQNQEILPILRLERLNFQISIYNFEASFCFF